MDARVTADNIPADAATDPLSLVAGIEDRQLRVWRTFIDTHAAVIRRLEEELETRHHLPLTDYDVFVQLDEAERAGGDGLDTHGLRVQELAERVVLTRSGVSRLVDRMQAHGLVARQPCPTDRRGTVVVLTDAGRRALAEARPHHHAGIREHFTQHLTEAETAALDTALSKILGAARGAAPSSTPTPNRC